MKKTMRGRSGRGAAAELARGSGRRMIINSPKTMTYLPVYEIIKEVEIETYTGLLE